MNFKEQARASIEQLDADQMEADQKRVEAILAGPTLIPQQEAQPQAPATRKKRSDAGIPKDPKRVDLELPITLTLPLEDARSIGIAAVSLELAAIVQDQIIAQLQKRIDLLQKSAPK